jgi:hypothetical protein
MLHRQTVYFASKFDRLSKIPAGISFAPQRGRKPDWAVNDTVLALVLTSRRYPFTIHLETAAFVFHINATTQGITGSLRAACSDPVQRFLACPFS